MSQDTLILLLLKVFLICGFTTLIAWVVIYTRLTGGGAWRNPIGQTLIIKTLLIAALFIPQVLALFFHLNRFDSHVAAWADVTLVGLVTPVMIWRSVVWLRLSRRDRDRDRAAERQGGAGGGIPPGPA
jgi:hypothetical protein